MTFKEHLKSVYKMNVLNFSGRASLSEYWFTWLSAPLFIIIASLPSILLGAIFGQSGFYVGLAIYYIVAIALLVPQLSVTVRRLHDAGKSSWWLLVALIPFGVIVVLLFLLKESDGNNRWGKSTSNNIQQ